MSSRFQPICLDNIQTFPVAERLSKTERRMFGAPPAEDASFSDFWQSLPDVLAARELRELVRHIVRARGSQPIIWMMGAHPIKVGLSRILIDLLKRGFISCLATHGAFTVHDCEVALFGRTSEDVADTLRDGRFGMAKETGEFYVRAVRDAADRDVGLGEALAEALIRERAPYAADSLLVQCLEANVPLTVHVAIGTDIVHEHPGLRGDVLGRTSYRDFLVFCNMLTKLGTGGVAINVGSAVLMPEVFVKALAVVRNLGYPCHGFVTANFDMIPHYRPQQNVIHRPTLTGGRGFSFTGHHEIMIPLLAAALVQESQTS